MQYGTPEKFNQHFQEDFREENFEAFFNLINDGYLTGCDVHLPQSGSDGMSFGTNVYKFISHNLSMLAEGSDYINVLSRNPFRIQFKRFELAFHKVGKTGLEPIETSFPHSATAARESRFIQLSFERELLGQEAYAEEVPYNLVLAHMGNPEEGFCALYLCRPGKVVDGKIQEWEFT